MARKNGFSLAEVLIAMLLIGILSATVMKVMKDRDNTLEHQSKRDKAITNMQNVLKERMFNAKIDEADNALVIAALDTLSSQNNKLRDGVTYSVTGGSGNYIATVEIDANGKDIPPNKERMDVFKYYVDKYGNFINQDLANGNKLEAGGTSRWGAQLPISGTGNNNQNNDDNKNENKNDDKNKGNNNSGGVKVPQGDPVNPDDKVDDNNNNNDNNNDIQNSNDQNNNENNQDDNNNNTQSDTQDGEQNNNNNEENNTPNNNTNNEPNDGNGNNGDIGTKTCADGSVISENETCMKTCATGIVIAENETCTACNDGYFVQNGNCAKANGKITLNFDFGYNKKTKQFVLMDREQGLTTQTSNEFSTNNGGAKVEYEMYIYSHKTGTYSPITYIGAYNKSLEDFNTSDVDKKLRGEYTIAVRVLINGYPADGISSGAGRYLLSMSSGKTDTILHWYPYDKMYRYKENVTNIIENAPWK